MPGRGMVKKAADSDQARPVGRTGPETGAVITGRNPALGQALIGTTTSITIISISTNYRAGWCGLLSDCPASLPLSALLIGKV